MRLLQFRFTATELNDLDSAVGAVTVIAPSGSGNIIGYVDITIASQSSKEGE